MYSVMPPFERVKLTTIMFAMKQCYIYFVFNIIRSDFHFSKQLKKSSSIDATDELTHGFLLLK